MESMCVPVGGRYVLTYISNLCTVLILSFPKPSLRLVDFDFTSPLLDDVQMLPGVPGMISPVVRTPRL